MDTDATLLDTRHESSDSPETGAHTQPVDCRLIMLFHVAVSRVARFRFNVGRLCFVLCHTRHTHQVCDQRGTDISADCLSPRGLRSRDEESQPCSHCFVISAICFVHTLHQRMGDLLVASYRILSDVCRNSVGSRNSRCLLYARLLTSLLRI